MKINMRRKIVGNQVGNTGILKKMKVEQHSVMEIQIDITLPMLINKLLLLIVTPITMQKTMHGGKELSQIATSKT